MEKLTPYIYDQLQSGVSPDEITSQLRASGWGEDAISGAFKAVQAQIVPSGPPVTGDEPKSSGHKLAQFQASGKKRGRIKTAWLLMKQSLKVLNGNKQLLYYPFMGGLMSILLTVIFALILFLNRDTLIYTAKDAFGDDEVYLKGPGYIVGFAYYIIAYFVIFTYNAGLAVHVLDIFRGKSETTKHYMGIAWSKKGQLFVYSLIASTVGLILHFIEQRARWLGWLVSRILGALWALANLFTIPIIVESDSSAPSAIKQSTKLFISRWGENVAARITFGGLMFLVYLFILIPLIIVLSILLAGLGPVGLFMLLAFVIIAIILFATVETAASNVLNTALYYFAKNGHVPAAYDADLLNSALIPKKNRRGLFGKKSTPTPA